MTVTPFTAAPKANAGRDTKPDISILLFAHTARPAQEWEGMVKAEGEQAFRTKIWKATGALDLEFRHVQPLDVQRKDEDSRVLEILAHTSHSFLNMEDCLRFRRHETVKTWERDNAAAVIFQPAPLYFAHKTAGFAVFDMDSTLIQQEVIDELARKVGLYDQVAAITEAAMRGEAPYTDFEASLRARARLLSGVPVSVWGELKRDVISFTPGGLDLARALKKMGWKTAVLSGGFTPLAEWVRETLGLDYAFANHLVEDAETETLTGELVADKPIIHGAKKRELLLDLARQSKFPLDRTVAVGDGSNDLPMMHAAGLGIAFNAKPKVQDAAPARLNATSLLDIMYVLGFTKQEILAAR